MKIILGIIAFISLLHISLGCTISDGWQDLTMEERLVLSDIIVYGKTTQHVANVETIEGKSTFFIDAVFDVYCVLRPGEDPIPREITIAKVAPRDGCSGSGSHMGMEKEAIVGLRKRLDGKYEYHEMMPTLSATFAPSRTNFFTISHLCGLQQWQTPADALENRCPVCGTSNFTEASLKADENEILSPCIINGIDFRNSTVCHLFEAENPDNMTVCVPATYSQTCTQLTVVDDGVTCDCSTDTDTNRQGNFVSVNAADHVASRMAHVVFGAVVAGLLSVSVIKQL